MPIRTARTSSFQHRPARLRTLSAWLLAGLIGLPAASGASPAQSKAPRAGPADATRLSPGTDLKRWCRGVTALETEGRLERCLSFDLSEGDGRSVKGIPLWSTDIVPPAETPPPLRVLVLGGIHADEAASVILVMDWIARARQAGTAQAVHWRMAPLVNPDGFFLPSRTRVNARGVDLNRNFATRQWGEQARPYWIKATRRDPRRFPGPAALSEPESLWVHRQIETFQPQLIVSVHAPYGVLDFDGPPPPPSRLGNLMLDQVGIYPGSLGNYGGVVLGVPVVTIELRNASRVPATDAAAMWNDLQAWIGRKLLSAGGVTASASPGRAAGEEPAQAGE